MTDLDTRYLFLKKKRAQRIPSCLNVLGMRDAFAATDATKSGAHKIITQRYTTAELRELVEYYYRQSAKRYHPDHFTDPDRRQQAEEMMKIINCTRDRALRILHNRERY